MRKRPCRFCHGWFSPDRRVGDRQRACRSEACRKRRRQATQAAWRRANPDYAVRRRLEQREVLREREPLPVPRPLDRIPWELAQEEFDRRGADLLASLGKVLVRSRKDEIRV